MEGYEKRYSFWEGFTRSMQYMSDEQELCFRRAIDEFCFNGKQPSFDDNTLNVAWQLIVATLEKSVKYSESGRLGGRPRKDEKTLKSLSKTLLSPLKTEEEKEEEIEIEKEKEIASDTPISKASVFVCKECGCKVSKSASSPNWRCDVCYTVYKPNELNQLKRIRA